MPTDAENAASAVSIYWGILAALDAVPVQLRAMMSYTDDAGRAFGWNEYRASILGAIEKIQGAGKGGSSLAQQAGGPFTVYS